MSHLEPSASETVLHFLESLAERLWEEMELLDGGAQVRSDRGTTGTGEAATRVLSDGAVFERAAVGLTQSRGAMLPLAATERRLELAGRPYQALSLTLVAHPRNPHVPAAHLGLRFFTTEEPTPVWWFGGSSTLLPSSPFPEDVRHWHRTLREALLPFGGDLYPRFKEACDRSGTLPHRGESVGVGGIAFDEFAEGDFDRCFALLQSVGDAFLPGYAPIVTRRREHPFGERERAFQLERRGRWVEYVLLRDRSIHFGLQSGGRVESILMALPPLAAWTGSPSHLPGSPEEWMVKEFLHPRDWLADERNLNFTG